MLLVSALLRYREAHMEAQGVTWRRKHDFFKWAQEMLGGRCRFAFCSHFLEQKRAHYALQSHVAQEKALTLRSYS